MREKKSSLAKKKKKEWIRRTLLKDRKHIIKMGERY